MAKIALTKAQDIPAGQTRTFDIEGKRIAVFNIAGSFHAIDDVCLHKGGPLGEGTLEGEVVTCPWHQWRWNVKSGACLLNPALAVKCYPLITEGNQLFVEI